MHFWESDDTLYTNAVLSSSLKGASQQDGSNVVDISYGASVLQNDSWVLAAKFDGQRC